MCLYLITVFIILALKLTTPCSFDLNAGWAASTNRVKLGLSLVYVQAQFLNVWRRWLGL